MEVVSFSPVFLFREFFPKAVVCFMVLWVFGFDKLTKESALRFFILEYFVIVPRRQGSLDGIFTFSFEREANFY